MTLWPVKLVLKQIFLLNKFIVYLTKLYLNFKLCNEKAHWVCTTFMNIKLITNWCLMLSLSEPMFLLTIFHPEATCTVIQENFSIWKFFSDCHIICGPEALSIGQYHPQQWYFPRVALWLACYPLSPVYKWYINVKGILFVNLFKLSWIMNDTFVLTVCERPEERHWQLLVPDKRRTAESKFYCEI
jgi:hypothetical protein